MYEVSFRKKICWKKLTTVYETALVLIIFIYNYKKIKNKQFKTLNINYKIITYCTAIFFFFLAYIEKIKLLIYVKSFCDFFDNKTFIIVFVFLIFTLVLSSMKKQKIEVD